MKEKILKGKRALLRPPTRDDCPEFIEQSRKSAKFHRNLVSPPKDAADFAEFLERAEKIENESFLIIEVESQLIAGAVNLSQIFRRGFQNAYLGYYLFEKFTGKNLATEAVWLMLRHSFKTLKLHRLEANVQPENRASTRVLEKNGFAREGFSPKYLKIGGRWRDHERWAIVREHWKENV